MTILLSLLLAQARVLPEIDRRALDLQARAEALQSRRPARAAVAAVAAPPVAQTAAAPRRAAVQPTRAQPVRAQIRTASATRGFPTLRRASGGTLDLSSITTICRAAGNQSDPATFISTLSRAYSLSSGENSSLRSSCAAYLAGRADARVNSYDVPAH